ncbi:MAG: YraN family protein [Defluviitaleaceae bacterium]|nr:YraN family protein [Defluviitaleaceae bacterium]
MDKQATGKAGQKAAETLLKNKGYQIITRNFHSRTGEVDLVARDGDYIVFVEVKARHNLNYGYPREAITPTKQKRIIKTALAFLTFYSLTDSNIRFDVIEVLLRDGQVYTSHIENAFTG